jgi:hypothetical protein
VSYLLDTPDAPPCVDAHHEWLSPHSWLGGDPNHPGELLIDDGIIIKEACVRCGSSRTTISIKNPDETYFRRMSYIPGEYSHRLY